MTRSEGDSGPSRLRVSRLRIHPVKGARGCDVEVLDFDEIGPRGDRRWMIVQPDGDFLSQRAAPALATIRAELDAASLTLRAPNAPAVTLPVAPSGQRMRVRVWSSSLEVARVGPEADRWLESVLGTPHHLVHMGPGDLRPTDPAYAPGHRVSFADGYPALVVTRGSVDELSRRAGRTLPVERFRPNVVIDGARPHAEDFWRRFAIGERRFSGVKLCARCKVTTLDQETGDRDPDGEPLRTLSRYRRIENLVYFGLNAVHEGAGRIRVGDPVRILDRGIVRGAL